MRTSRLVSVLFVFAGLHVACGQTATDQRSPVDASADDTATADVQADVPQADVSPDTQADAAPDATVDMDTQTADVSADAVQATDTPGADVATTDTVSTDVQPANPCGNGVLDTDEACDGALLSATFCTEKGYLGGKLACSSTCTFDISACTGPTIAPEPNDAFATATLLQPGLVAPFALGGRMTGGVDIYQIDVPAGVTLKLETIDPSGQNACGTATVTPGVADLDTKLTVYAADFTALGANDNIQEADPLTTPGANYCSAVTLDVAAAGTYYVEIAGHASATVSDAQGVHPAGYQLNATVTPWTCVPSTGLPCEVANNDAPDTAQPIDTGAHGLLLPALESDFYSVTVADDDTYLVLDIQDGGQGACAAGTFDTALVLLAADGTTVVAQNDDESPTNHCSRVQATVAKGTYVVQVTGKSAGKALAYELHVARGVAQLVQAQAGGALALPASFAGAGATVNIPAGALAADTMIAILDGAPVAYPTATTSGPAVQLEPAGLQFALPVQVTLPGKGASGELLVVLHRDDQTGQVDVRLPSPGGVPGLLLVKTTSFSTYQPATMPPPALTWNATTLPAAQDGSGAVVGALTATVQNDKLKGTVGQPLSPTIGGGQPRISGLAGTGLTPKLVVTGPTTLKLTVDGWHNTPVPKTGITEFQLYFEAADFVSGNWPQVVVVNVTIDWSVRAMSYSRVVFHENATLNDGTVPVVSTLTLLNESFAAPVGTSVGQVTGAPAGLTPVLQVTGPKTATLSFTGQATDPVNGTWSDAGADAGVTTPISVKFADADFVGGKAAGILGANRTDLEVVLFRFPGFVYTGLPGGQYADMEAYDFGAGERVLYWQPMLAENGLAESAFGPTMCSYGDTCVLLNFGPEDRLAFKINAGANPHGADGGPALTGCADDKAGNQSLANCTLDKWYPTHLRTKLRGVGAVEAIVYDQLRTWTDFTGSGELPPMDPSAIGTEPAVPGDYNDCGSAQVCCGYADPYWVQQDIGSGIGAAFTGPFGFWPVDPIAAASAWMPETSWGWDVNNHPLVGGPTDRFNLNWTGAKGMRLTLLSTITCPDIRLVSGHRVDVCEGFQLPTPNMTVMAQTKIVGFPLSWTTNCTGSWGLPSSTCVAMWEKQSQYSTCFGAPSATGAGNRVRFY